MKDNKNTILIIAVIAVIVLIGLAVVMMSDTELTEDEKRVIEHSETPPGNNENSPEVTGVPLDPEEELEAYKLWAKYPPTSRPLHEGQLDLLKPFKLPRTPIRVIAKKAEGCSAPDSTGKVVCEKKAELAEISCKLQPQNSHSFGTGDFHIFLHCISLKDNSKVEVSNIKARVFRQFNRKTYNSLPPIGFGDNGDHGDQTAGDKIYTFLVRPGTNDWGPMYIETKFNVMGIDHVQQIDWFSTPHIVGNISGGVRDNIRDGHLVIDVPVNIKKAGYYEFRANLQELSGEKRMVASASVKKRLKKGPQVVELQFWGKVINDSEIDGPYLVRNIRGFRDNGVMPADELKQYVMKGEIPEPRETTEPAQEYMKPADDHKTQGYKSDQFTDQEWESEEKSKRINYLQSKVNQ